MTGELDPSLMTEEQYMELLGLGNQNMDLERQMAMADKLRGAPDVRQMGRIAVAPNFLEYAGALANQNVFQNAGKQKTANTGQQNRMVANAILGSRTPKPQPPQAPEYDPSIASIGMSY